MSSAGRTKCAGMGLRLAYTWGMSESKSYSIPVKLGVCTWNSEDGCQYSIDDQCGKTLQDCKDHFPSATVFPFRGFPKLVVKA